MNEELKNENQINRPFNNLISNNQGTITIA